MSAPRHQRAALLKQAVEIRDEWQRVGTACGPADRSEAEQAIGALYLRLGRPRPRFVWVRSPHEAQPLVADSPTLQDMYRWVKAPPVKGRAPFVSEFATAVSRLRGRLEAHIMPPWFDPPPAKKGDSFVTEVRVQVREVLYDVLAHGFYLPAKRLLGESTPVCWYGQQEAHWIAYYDVWRRLGLADYGEGLDAELGEWQAIARTSGWFWPSADSCVVSEKPVTTRVFADGWRVGQDG